MKIQRTILALSLLVGFLTARPAGALTAVEFLGNVLNGGELTCKVLKADWSPSHYFISVRNGAVVVRAKDSRDALYSADHAKLAKDPKRPGKDCIKLYVTNDVDGPLSEDLLILPMDGIENLVRNATSGLEAEELLGKVFTHESFDGTSDSSDLRIDYVRPK